MHELLVIAHCMSGCYLWRTQPVASTQMLADRRTPKLRITRNDGARVILEKPTMRGDTIVGILSSDSSTTDGVRIPLSDVREVASWRVSAWRTTAAVTGVTADALLALATAAINAACASQYDCRVVNAGVEEPPADVAGGGVRRARELLGK